MKIKLSKSQWEMIGKTAGWKKTAQGTQGVEKQLVSELTSMIQQIRSLYKDFSEKSSLIGKEKFDLIGTDCDSIRQDLDNAAGRMSAVIRKIILSNRQAPSTPQDPSSPQTK